MRPRMPLLAATLSLAACSASPAGRSTPEPGGARDPASAASSAPSLLPAPLPPIEQLVARGHLICALREGDAYCWDDNYRNPFKLQRRGPLARIAVTGFGGRLCATDDAGAVRCGGQDLSIRDPEGNLEASENTVCAFSGGVIDCELLSRGFDKAPPRAVQLRLPAEAGAVSFVSVYDDFERTYVAAVDSHGAVFSWGNIRAAELAEPQRWAIKPMRMVRINRNGFAGITQGGDVLYDENVIGLGHGRKRLCGVEGALDVQIGMHTICVRTVAGVVCAKHKFVREDDQRVGPLHESCHGPRGPMARTDVTHMALSELTPLCVATQAGEVLCRAGRDAARWPAALPAIHQDAVEMASGEHFNCARLQDGSVRCAGPGFGDLGHTEPLAELQGAQRLIAGDQALCGLLGDRLHCFYRGSSDGLAQHARWFPMRSAKVGTPPDRLQVDNRRVWWERGGKVYRYRISLPHEDDSARWLLQPARAGQGQPRFHLDEVRLVAKGSERIRATSGHYTLRDDGLLFRVKQKGLGLGELAFGLLTGGIMLPVMAMGQPVQRTELTTLPDAVELAAGVSHLCYRNRDGSVYCFGYNDDGEVRTFPGGFHTAAKSAQRIELGEPARQITAGNFHSCARLDSGKVRCWGGWGYRLIRPLTDYPGLAKVPWAGGASDQRPADP